MKRTTVGLISAAALAVTTLTACGGDDDIASFCEDGNGAADALSGISASDPAGAVEAFQKVTDEAPSEIKPAFETILGELEKMESDPAGIDVEAMTEAQTEITTWISDNCS